MMLIKDFYTIQQIEEVHQKLEATLILNADHQVYQGHFPEQPVVPGVVQLQIVKELLEKHLDKKLTINNMSQAKFLGLIVPDTNPVQFTIAYSFTEEQTIKADATIETTNGMATKAKIVYNITIIPVFP